MAVSASVTDWPGCFHDYRREKEKKYTCILVHGHLLEKGDPICPFVDHRSSLTIPACITFVLCGMSELASYLHGDHHNFIFIKQSNLDDGTLTTEKMDENSNEFIKAVCANFGKISIHLS